MPSETPATSVLIVTYESAQDIDACLQSLAPEVAAGSVEVIVADNNSSDGTVDLVASTYPAVTIIEMGSNAGFARANNVALTKSRGRHVLLLNPDTVVHRGAIERLSGVLDQEAAVGIVAPKLLNPDGSDQGTARRFPTPAASIFGRRSPITRLFPRNRWSRRFMMGLDHVGDDPFPVDWVSGAALCIRRSVMDEIGGLDEGFFMHFEDADLCRRAKDAGWQVWCVPPARITHREGGSRRGWPPSQVRHFHYGAYRYWSKHHARGRLNPLRPAAAGALSVRAVLVMLRNIRSRPSIRPRREVPA